MQDRHRLRGFRMTHPTLDRLTALRARLADLGVDGLIVPHADEHLSEYLPPSAERLAWLTGFDGSAGTAIILKDKAFLFVDGRYTIQAERQVDTSVFEIVDIMATAPSTWLADNLEAESRIGHDPWLLTMAEVKRMADSATKAGGSLVALDENPVDSVWRDRPEPPAAPVSRHPVEFAGRSAADKLYDLAETLIAQRANATVLVRADSIAWTFNIRGSDTAHNPAPLAFAILKAEGKPALYIDGRKLSNAVRADLAAIADIHEVASLKAALADLGGQRVLLDPASTPRAIATAVEAAGATIVEGSDPAERPKAIKNSTELDGARRAQRRDGAAMVRFLAWIDAHAQDGSVDEIAAADKLRELRAETARRDGSELVDIAFDTISGAGANGAIVHYRVTPDTTRRLEPGSLYLVDSGGQYRDGTTDITRTVAIGQPSAEMRDRFTRVLKGHIALATARFPAGTSGAQLDAFARRPLWEAGLDYAHGTGHGVGSFLSVHEGPANVSKRGKAPLVAGMILSNEPGFYREGAYGIRTENLVVVTEADVSSDAAPFLCFETITLCPIDRRLIDTTLLDATEIAWLDAYHAALPAALNDLLDDDERAWLADATRPLS